MRKALEEQERKLNRLCQKVKEESTEAMENMLERFRDQMLTHSNKGTEKVLETMGAMIKANMELSERRSAESMEQMEQRRERDREELKEE